MCDIPSIEGNDTSRGETHPWMQRLLSVGRCTGCGTCAGVCPENAITMVAKRDGTFHPLSESARCNGCGLCRRVCPAESYDPAAFCDLFPSSARFHPLVGWHLYTWTGHATDQAVRFNSTSGGIATALLLDIFKSGAVDAAVAVASTQEAPLVSRTVLVHDEEAVRRCCGSRYMPVPLNTVLRDICCTPGHYAIVGLPCHVRGLRKAQREIPEVRERLCLVVGLVCSHALQATGFEYLFEKMGLALTDIREVSFAGVGWPGGITVRLADGTSRFMPRLRSLFADVFGSHLFTPPCCHDCSDLAAEAADISLGDAWLPRMLRSDRAGSSLVISRTAAGHDAMVAAMGNRSISMTQVPLKDFIRAQRGGLYFKKANLLARRRIRFWSGGSPSGDLTPLPSPALVDYLLALYPLVNERIGRSALADKLLAHLPAVAVRAPRMVFKLLTLARARHLEGKS